MSSTPILRSLFLVSLLSGHLVAQPGQVLNAAPEPFSIKPGSTFTASGAGQRPVPSTSATTRLSSDIGEAEAIIRDNFVGSRGVTNAEMTKDSLTGALRSLDPHSNFFDQTEWKDLMDEEQSGYSGIGATIGSFEKDGVLDTFILSTFSGSGAAKAQLRFGDRIIAINNENVSGKDPDAVRNKLRGPEGTTFRLTVERASTLRPETIEIRRGRVAQPSIPSYYLLKPGVGYIELSEGFNYTTDDEFDNALRELKKQGMRSLVLDLRGNGGGIVEQAVGVAERFLPTGTLILTQRGRSRYDNRVWKSANPVPETLPLVLLVDENTASASEIVAGALQDNDRALIVGEKTFGKGLVQSVIDLPAKTGLTLTTARYLTPSGRSIQRDYSKLDTYDYFSHKTADIGTAYFEARTITNRRVYGGDGILPDSVIKTSELTASQTGLLDPLFFFARDLVNGRVGSQGTYRPASITYPAEAASDARLSVNDAFRSFLLSSPRWARLASAPDADFIAKRVRYYATMSTSGSVTADQVLIETDPQVARAVASLPASGDLARAANQARQQHP